MSLFSDIGNLVNDVAHLATDVMGAALSAEFAPLQIAQSLANALTQAVGQAVQQAVQQLQTQGMPNFLANDIQQLINNVMQQLQNPTNPSADNSVNQQFGNQINNLMQSLANQIAQGTLQNKKGGGGAGSWLEAMAEALGNALNAQAAKVQQLSQQITSANATDQPKVLAQFSAESQRLSFMMNTVDNAIKTIGEGLATLGKKN